MFYTEEKFACRVRELEDRRYVDMVSIAPLTAMEGTLGVDAVYCSMPDHIQGGTLNVGDDFQGRDRYLWVQKKVVMPQAREGYEVVGRFDFGKTGGGHNSGFEALLYVDGHPYQGVDTNHPDVVFQSYQGQETELTFMLWTGLEEGGPRREQRQRVSLAAIGYLHKAADQFYYYAKAVAETIGLLEKDRCERYELMQALDKALLEINWDADAFHRTVEDALTVLLEELGRLEKRSDITVHCVGHTHIDVAWLWRLKHTREKAMRSFSTVLRLMEEFDEYIFLQTQPQLYRYIQEDCPELFAKIREKVREGRWEADGGMWLEADCNVTSGESLARQFQHGIRYLKNEMGVTCQYLWLPDVFGYSWALPQIMKLCGLKTFMTTKISWNQFNTIPNDLFWWRGMDGSEVLTYFIEVPGEGASFDNRYSTYNGYLNPHSVIGSWKKFKNKEISHDTLISYGYGDGGGGVNRDMLKMRRAMDAIPGLPHVKTGTAAEFFDGIHRDASAAGTEVATWDGELYLEYHRGTYTTQAHNKKMNRLLEFKLAQAEWLSSMAYLSGGIYEGGALYDCWETVLRNQFHDIIPGSSIREVYEDSAKEYAATLGQVERIEAEALNRLSRADERAVTVYNFSSFPRKDRVRLPVSEGFEKYTNAQGQALEAQVADGFAEVLVQIKPLSCETIYCAFGQAQKDADWVSVDLSARTLETPYYAIAWTENGALSRIYDREQDRQILAEGGRGNILEIFEDKPMAHDAWDIDIFYTQKREEAALVEPAHLVESGPLKAVLGMAYRYNRSTICQRMVVYRDSRRIDFETQVDWHEDHRLLKVAFETNIRSTKATYDIQYGHVERPTHFNTSWDWARFEVVGHKWADLSEAGYGVSLLNDCKYGYNIKDRTVKLSLLKSSKSPDTEADMGVHSFTYSLYPHVGGLLDGGTIEEGTALNLPLIWAEGGSVAAGRQLFALSSNQICIDAVKKAEDEDCLVLRVHECHGGRAPVTITSDFGIQAFALCNILEEEQEAWQTGDRIQTVLKPFEIRNYKVKFSQMKSAR